MKFLAILALLFTANVYANDNDYRRLLPPTPVSFMDLQNLLEQSDTILADNSAGKIVDQLHKEHDAAVAKLLAEKDALREQADRGIAACEKDYQCVAKVRQDLQTNLAKIHDQIRGLDAKLVEAIKVAEAEVAKIKMQLTQILHASICSYIFADIEKQFAKIPGVSLESYFLQQANLTFDELIQWFKKFSGSYMINSELGGALGVSFFFRTPTKETQAVVLGFISGSGKTDVNHKYYYLAKFIRSLKPNEGVHFDTAAIANDLSTSANVKYLKNFETNLDDMHFTFSIGKLIYDEVQL